MDLEVTSDQRRSGAAYLDQLHFFFKIHQELNIQPGFALPLSGLAFLLFVIINMIYFRMRNPR